MKWLIGRKTTSAFGFAFLVGAALSILSLFHFYRFVEVSRWIQRAQSLLNELAHTRSEVIEAESAARAYVITGEKDYLDPYLKIVPDLEKHLRHLKVLTADDPFEAGEISLLENEISIRIALLRDFIRARGGSGPEDALRKILSGQEKLVMARIQARFAALQSREDGLLKQRTRDWQSAARRTAIVVGIGSAMALAMLVLAILATNREITARKQAEEERDRFFVLSRDLFCVAGNDGHFKRLNAAWTSTLGYTASELQSRPYLEFVHPEDREATLAEARKLAHGAHTVSFENRYSTKDGSYRWLSWTAAPLPERDLVYAVARDVTERKQAEESIRQLNDQLERRVAERTEKLKRANQDLQNEIARRQRLEEQLVQAQKMEAIGRLAGGVAHDFNNLLTVINGYSEMLLDRAQIDTQEHTQLNEIRNSGERAAALTRQLLAFSRKQVMTPEVVDLNKIVTNMDNMLRRLIGEDLRLITICGAQLGRVKADPSQLEQVLMNLAVNARDAMPHGGHLTIETSNVELTEAYSAAHAEVPPGSYVMLAVSDTGVGMDAETRSRIFEPFFTTKEKSKGTGLGLATVYGIVKQSGGWIWVYSEPGQGTTFKIYLTRCDEAAALEREPQRPGHTARGFETVLLVEDEPSVRAMVLSVLLSNGYRVLEAGNGEEALSICRKHEGPIHLLLTDVVMPGMSGREVADAITSLRRETKVLYMSGYTDDAIVNHGVLDPAMAFLEKPMTPDALRRRVREVLEGTQGGRKPAA